jgi:ATP-dependent DNA helicase RecG
MLRAELSELIGNGENSGVEFKRDDVHIESLAREVAALLNLEGGHILLGVADDGAVTGLTREAKKVEEWVMTMCRDHVQPAIIPFWETLPWDEATRIGVITLPADSPDKPYKARQGSAWLTKVRVGTTTRDATREEEARLYQTSGLLRYDIKPMPGATPDDLDWRRIHNYFHDLLTYEVPLLDDRAAWEQILLNTDLLVANRGRAIPTVAGLLFFGLRPNRFLPQAGITATAYPGLEKDYATVDEAVIRGPLPAVLSAERELVETGVIDRAVEFVRRNMGTIAYLDGARRVTRDAFPDAAIREAIVNAVAHRDYSITVTDIELSLYSDRLEVISPGRLPNTVTVDKMRMGYRAARNELIKDILRDYRYVEARGMGVRRHIIEGMRRHNGTEPDLIEEESRFIVRLWKEPRPSEPRSVP